MTSRHADGPLAKAAANASWTPVFELIGMILDQPISAPSLGRSWPFGVPGATN
jgi:hypothetical protein